MKHLQLRRNRYYLHWNIPADLRAHPLFNGKSIYTKSLQTSDLMKARRYRDTIVSEFLDLVAQVRERPIRTHLNNLIAEIRAATAAGQVQTKVPTQAQPQAPANLQPNDCARADGDASPKKAITLTKAVAAFVAANKHSDATTSKARNGAQSFLVALGVKDMPLHQIEPRDVTRWLQAISSEKSDWTRKGYRSALSSCWEWSYLLKDVDGANPFTAAKFKSGIAPQKYKPFTHEQLSIMVGAAAPQLRHLMKFALVTGCRIGELVSLTSDDFEMKAGIPLIRIRDGKTANAVRGIPLPPPFWEELKGHVKSGLWLDRTGKANPSALSAKFSLFKGDITGEREKQQCFHSFRGMTITAYENAGVPEGMTSQIVGHSKQGLTMSYGLYSSGYNYSRQLAAVEQMLREDAMRQFLKLF